MKFEFIANACGIFHGDDGTRLLCDPWIVNGVFDGSWCHYPPLKTTLDDLQDVDGIYVSHIHPDHYDDRYFNFAKDTPLIVLDDGPNFLIKNLTRSGFTNLVRIKNGETKKWKEFELTLFSPFTKHNYVEAKIGNLIDSALVVKNGEHIAFNANDNTPTVEACKMLRERFGFVQLAMINYNAAGPYPSCFNNLSEDKKIAEHGRILQRNYDHMVNVIKELKPANVLPFAGAYVLGGRLHNKNRYLATSTWDKCADYIRAKVVQESKIVCMRENDVLDINTGELDRPYIPIDEQHMQNYIEQTLSQIKYPYEQDEMPDSEKLLNDINEASTLMRERMARYDIEVESTIYIDFGSQPVIVFQPKNLQQRSITCTIDARLLRRILDRKSHWNNAEIGCHIEFFREPNIYDPDLHTALQFLHL